MNEFSLETGEVEFHGRDEDLEGGFLWALFGFVLNERFVKLDCGPWGKIAQRTPLAKRLSGGAVALHGLG